ALALCSCGTLLGMFSLAATPLSELASGAEPTAWSESSPSRKPLQRSGLDAPPGRKPGTANDANSLGNPVLANQQPAPLSAQQPAGSESMPLAPAAQSGWSIVTSPNSSTTQN